MDLWFTEYHSDGVRFSIRVKEQIISLKSQYQQIDIFDSYDLGRILVLDGFLMVTEKDESVYHEMITHVPMAVNPEIKKVLVIGAGDGGTIRELAKYKSIEEMVLVEIDQEVVRLSRQYLDFTACGLEDRRLQIYFEDGLKYIRRQENYFDLIIVDSTDPFGPGEGLFTKEFYGNCYKALKPNGILVNQHESPFYPKDAIAMQRAHQKIAQVFPLAQVYQAHIPTYPSGHWLFGFAAKTFQPLDLKQQNLWESYQIQTKYYNLPLHHGAFALPNYVKDMLK